MALVAQPFDRRGNDDWKNNRGDGNESESDSSSDDEEKPQKKKVMFVRCPKCCDKKKMCAECNKRRNCEASERYRKKNKRMQAALKRLKKEKCVLNAKLEVHAENIEFVRQLIASGAIFCRGCSGQLVPIPAGHVAPQAQPQAAVQPNWNVAAQPPQPPHVMPNYSALHPHHADQPMLDGPMESPLNGDPMLGAGNLTIDLDDIGFWLNDKDSGDN